MRFYLMSNSIVNGENLNFSESGVDEVAKKFVNMLKNILSFYALYAEHDDGRIPDGTHVLDAWVLTRLQETLQNETSAMEAYNLSEAARGLQHFVTDLSTWYVRRSRDRVKDSSEDRAETLATLRFVLETFAKMCAPFTPFLAEIMYKDIGGKKESVHLEDWPLVNSVYTNNSLIEQMGHIRSIVSKILDRRTEVGIPVKQVLAKAIVTCPEGMLEEAFAQVIKEEVNVKEILFQKGDYAVELDLTLTPELIREGTMREITRRVNAMRKNAGLTIQDRIELVIHTKEMEILTALTEHKDTLLASVLAISLRTEGDMPEISESLRTNDFDMVIGICKKIKPF